jgi:trans-o-hydroxybenzylidenepyruvate hydratase-aldolase
MLKATDLTRLLAIMPTPAKPSAERFGATQTVDLDETARLVENLIRDGAKGHITVGTTGECAMRKLISLQAQGLRRA